MKLKILKDLLSLPRKKLIPMLELVISDKNAKGKDLKCPQGHSGSIYAVLRDKKHHHVLLQEYACHTHSPTFILPHTVEEALNRLERRRKQQSAQAEVVDRQGSSKKLRRQGYELVRYDNSTCRNCGGHAESRVLRPAGGGRPVSSWFLCERCSPANFFLPETAEEAYERYLRKLEKRQGGEVVGTYVPIAA